MSKEKEYLLNKPALSVSVAEASRMIGIAVRTMREKVKNGEIDYARDGRRILIPVRSLEDYLEKRMVKGSEIRAIANGIIAKGIRGGAA